MLKEMNQWLHAELLPICLTLKWLWKQRTVLVWLFQFLLGLLTTTISLTGSPIEERPPFPYFNAVRWALPFITPIYFIYTEIFASNFSVWKSVSDFTLTNQRGETSFSHVKKSFRPITNQKRIVFSRAFSRSSRVSLSGSFDKIIFLVYSSCS